MILKYGYYSGLSSEPNVTTKVKEGGRRERTREGTVTSTKVSEVVC